MKPPIEDFSTPVTLPARWYKKLNALAVQYGKPRLEILEEALKHYARVLKLGAAGAVEATAHAKQSGTYIKNWWATLTPEMREKEAAKRRNAALVRWSKAKEPDPRSR